MQFIIQLKTGSKEFNNGGRLPSLALRGAGWGGWGDGTSPRLRGWCWRWGLGMLWGALVWLCLMPGGVIWAVWGDGLIAGLVAVSPHGVFGPGAALCHFSAP